MMPRRHLVTVAVMILWTGIAKASDPSSPRASAFAKAAARQDAGVDKPNIVYLLTDDLGYGDVQCFNPGGKIKTPHMDRVAAEGMRFTDAHSGSSVCTPTRYGILTGRYSWRTRLKEFVLVGESKHLIPSDRMTVASLLKETGYQTAFIGKWHLGWDWAVKKTKGKNKGASRLPFDYSRPVINGPDINGFDTYFGHAASLDMPPYLYVENGRVTALPDRTTGNTGQKYWRDGPTGSDFKHMDVLPEFTRRGARYIKEQAKNAEPYFLYLALPAPHTPILPTPEWEGKSGLDNIYADFVMLTDDCIGQIEAAIRETGEADNTLFIVTSDNGCSKRANYSQLATKGHKPSAHYRGEKADIYEGGHRIPLIVRWPTHVKAASVCNDTTCLTDMLATCADIVGATLPDNAGEDSVSMLPNLLGTAKHTLREATVHHSINGSFAIRQGKWKLCFCADAGGFGRKARDTSSFQLFDLDSDPGEQNNVVEEHPEVVQSLRALMDSYIADGRSTPGKPQSNEGLTTYLGRLDHSRNR